MIKIDGRSISIIQANTGSIRFDIYGPDNEPFDLAGYTCTFMVKKSKLDEDSSAIINKFIFADESTTYIEFVLDPNDTNFDVGAYWWGLQIKKNDYVNECYSGPFFIIEGVINEW